MAQIVLMFMLSANRATSRKGLEVCMRRSNETLEKAVQPTVTLGPFRPFANAPDHCSRVLVCRHPLQSRSPWLGVGQECGAKLPFA